MDHYIVRDYQVDFFLLFLPKGPDDKENESIEGTVDAARACNNHEN